MLRRAGLLAAGAFMFATAGARAAEALLTAQTYTSGSSSYTIPSSASRVVIKTWGAGGAGQGTDDRYASGGAGGFASASYTVNGGEVIFIRPGSAGNWWSYGGGEASAAWINGGFKVIAGGGGQGGGDYEDTGEAGGEGGPAGPSGGAGGRNGGGGATQTAPGAGGAGAESGPDGYPGTGPMVLTTATSYANNGGNGSGRGGSGYYGGGGGGGHGSGPTGGGGGGSNFVDLGHGYVTDSIVSTGATWGLVPPFTSDVHYPGSNTGYGGRVEWNGQVDAGGGAVVLLVYTNQPPALSPTTIAGRIGQALTYQIVASNAPTSYTATGLPTGLALNSATGVVSGTPTVPGRFDALITATNAVGTTQATLAWTITPNISLSASVGRGPLAVTFTATLPAGSTDTISQYAWDFTNDGSADATGTTASYTYQNNTSAPITYVAKVTATYASGGTANFTRTITVYPASSYAVGVQDGTPTVPFLLNGNSTTITAAPPSAGFAFAGWTLVSGPGTIVNPASATATFIVGSADAQVRANFVPDIQSPSVPSGLCVGTVTATSVTIGWNPSIDNGVVAAYEIYNYDVLATTTTLTNATLINLQSGLPYRITVRAVDGAGNRSAPSGSVVGKTWERLLFQSGTIQSHTDASPPWGSSTTFSFTVPAAAGVVRLFTTGNLPLRATLSGPTYVGDIDGGGGDISYQQSLVSGVYSVTVRGRDAYAAGSFQVYADFGQGIQADFSVSTTSGNSPLPVAFDATKSMDPAGRTIVSYAWDFEGGGSTTGAATANHTFGYDVYYPKLTVTNTAGGTATFTRQIITANSSPGTSGGATISPSSGRIGSTVNISAPAYDSSGNPFHAWWLGVVEDHRNATAVLTLTPTSGFVLPNYWPSSGIQPPTTALSVSTAVASIYAPINVKATSNDSSPNLIWNRIDYSTDFGLSWVEGTVTAGSRWEGSATSNDLSKTFSFPNPGWVIFRAIASRAGNTAGSYFAYKKVLITAPSDGESIIVLNGSGNVASGGAGTVVSLSPLAGPAFAICWWELVAGSGTFSPSVYWPTPTFTKGAGPVVLRANYGVPSALSVLHGTTDRVMGASGSPFQLTADAAPSGYVFDHWEKRSGNGTFAIPTSATTTFTIGEFGAVVEAIYRPAGAPVVKIATSHYSILTGNPFSITASAEDSDSNLSSLAIDHSVDDGATWVPGSTIAQGSALDASKWTGTGAAAKSVTTRYLFSPVAGGRFRFRASARDASGNVSAYAYVDVMLVYDKPVTTLSIFSRAGETRSSTNQGASTISIPTTDTFTVYAKTTSGGASLDEERIDLSKDGGAWSEGNLANGRLWTAVDFNHGVLVNAVPELKKDYSAAELGAGTYVFRARGFDTSRYSDYQYVTVIVVPGAPVITAQPKPRGVSQGQAASFTVSVDSPTSVLYQWKKNGQSVAGATSASLAIASTQFGDVGEYSVLVANTAGSNLSDGAALNVEGQAPGINPGPQSQTVDVGASVTFSATVTGSAPMTYQWFKDNAAISGATGPAYAISSARKADAGVYKVTVTNPVGSSTSGTATLAVNAPPVIDLIIHRP